MPRAAIRVKYGTRSQSAIPATIGLKQDPGLVRTERERQTVPVRASATRHKVEWRGGNLRRNQPFTRGFPLPREPHPGGGGGPPGAGGGPHAKEGGCAPQS